MTNDRFYVRDFNAGVAILLLIIFFPLGILYILCAPKVAVQRAREPVPSRTAAHQHRITKQMRESASAAYAHQRAKTKAEYVRDSDTSSRNGFIIFMFIMGAFILSIVLMGT